MKFLDKHFHKIMAVMVFLTAAAITIGVIYGEKYEAEKTRKLEAIKKLDQLPK